MITSAKTKITKKEQDVAAKILTKFMFANNMIDVLEVWQKIYKEYHLQSDFFTKSLCEAEEFYKKQLEYAEHLKFEEFDFYDEF